MLDTWINNRYLNPVNFRLKFLNNQPFPHLEFNNFFKKEKLLKILTALITEEFYLKDSDLFTFFQTNDFSSTKNKALLGFFNFLRSEEFRAYLFKITNYNYSSTIDCFGTIYRDTHYLLPHDDRLEKKGG